MHGMNNVKRMTD